MFSVRVVLVEWALPAVWTRRRSPHFPSTFFVEPLVRNELIDRHTIVCLLSAVCVFLWLPLYYRCTVRWYMICSYSRILHSFSSHSKYLEIKFQQNFGMLMLVQLLKKTRDVSDFRNTGTDVPVPVPVPVPVQQFQEFISSPSVMFWYPILNVIEESKK